MTFRSTTSAAFAGALLLLLGCASENVSWRKFPSTTFAELSIPRGATIRVASSDDPEATAFADQLRKALRQSGLTVADGADPASYVVLVQGGTAFRADTPEEARYSGRVHVETVDSDSGSFQRVRRDRGSTLTAAREISLAVYAVKTLAPVHYLTFPIYEGVVSDAAAEGRAGSENQKLQAQFAKLAAARIEEVFAARPRTIRVPVPVEANEMLKVKFVKIESALAAGDDEQLQKTLSEIDVLAADPEVLSGTLEEFAKASAADGWEPPEGVTREAILGNYYLVALRREIGCVDPDMLSAIHASHLRILELCEGPSLRMACPIALGRLEAKLAHLRSR